MPPLVLEALQQRKDGGESDLGLTAVLNDLIEQGQHTLGHLCPKGSTMSISPLRSVGSQLLRFRKKRGK